MASNRTKYRRHTASGINARFRTVPPQDWFERLTQGPDGKPDGRSAENIALAITAAPEWQDVLCYDSFNLVVYLHRPVPQSSKLPPPNPKGYPRPMNEDDALAALTWFHGLGIVKATKTAVYDTMVKVAHDNAYHPVLDYFAAVCSSDAPAEVPSKINDHNIDPARPDLDALSLLFTLGFGAKDTALNREMSRSFMVSMVRRVRQPGCQNDHLPVLIGKQGTGKSSGLRALVGTDWFSDDMPKPGTKDAALQLHGKLLIEWAEMAAMKGAEVEKVKAFISRRYDRLRPPYGKVAQDFARSCSFAGSSNVPDFLDDPTGARRYWPVICGQVDIEWITANRDLLWRQACQLETGGAPGWIIDADLQAELLNEQADLQEPDAWDDSLAGYLETAPDGTTTADVLAKVGVPLQDRNRSHEMRAAKSLRRHGWEHWDRPNAPSGVKRPRRWRRKDAK
jgi:predicted P-loop ATPase